MYEPGSDSLSDWLPAVVTSRLGGVLAAVPLKLGLSASIPPERRLNIQYGDYALIRIRRNRDWRPGMRSTHFVIEARACPFSEWPPIRIDSIANAVVMKARVTFFKTATLNQNTYCLFENPDFGVVVDLHRKISVHQGTRMESAVVEFQAQSSPLRSEEIIFVIKEVVVMKMKARIADSNEDADEIVGLVTHIRPTGDAYVWMRDYPNVNVNLSTRYMPEGNLQGKWIKCRVADCDDLAGPRVCSHVKIIDALLPTRVVNGIPEVRGECVFLGKKMGFPILKNDVVGEVIDVHGYLPEYTPLNFVFSEWLVRYHSKEHTARWKLSKMQRPTFELLEKIQTCRQMSSMENSPQIARLEEYDQFSGEDVGFVGHMRCSGDAYVWTSSHQKDVELSKYYMPKSDMLGKWIKCHICFSDVRCKNCKITSMVEIIADVLPTRIMHGIPEIKAECVFVGRNKLGLAVLKNDVVGEVIDLHGYLPDFVPINFTLSEWLIRHHDEKHAARWKLSKLQKPTPELLEKIYSFKKLSAAGRNFIEPAGFYVKETEVSSKCSSLREPVCSSSGQCSSSLDRKVCSAKLEDDSDAEEKTSVHNSSTLSEPDYVDKTLKEMVCVLLENPVIADTIQREDMQAFARISNLIFDDY